MGPNPKAPEAVMSPAKALPPTLPASPCQARKDRSSISGRKGSLQIPAIEDRSPLKDEICRTREAVIATLDNAAKAIAEDTKQQIQLRSDLKHSQTQLKQINSEYAKLSERHDGFVEKAKHMKDKAEADQQRLVQQAEEIKSLGSHCTQLRKDHGLEIERLQVECREQLADARDKIVDLEKANGDMSAELKVCRKQAVREAEAYSSLMKERDLLSEENTSLLRRASIAEAEAKETWNEYTTWQTNLGNFVQRIPTGSHDHSNGCTSTVSIATLGSKLPDPNSTASAVLDVKEDPTVTSISDSEVTASASFTEHDVSSSTSDQGCATSSMTASSATFVPFESTNPPSAEPGEYALGNAEARATNNTAHRDFNSTPPTQPRIFFALPQQAPKRKQPNDHWEPDPRRRRQTSTRGAW